MEPLQIQIDFEKLKNDLVALEYPEFLESNQNFKDKIQTANVRDWFYLPRLFLNRLQMVRNSFINLFRKDLIG